MWESVVQSAQQAGKGEQVAGGGLQMAMHTVVCCLHGKSAVAVKYFNATLTCLGSLQ